MKISRIATDLNFFLAENNYFLFLNLKLIKKFENNQKSDKTRNCLNAFLPKSESE